MTVTQIDHQTSRPAADLQAIYVELVRLIDAGERTVIVPGQGRFSRPTTRRLTERERFARAVAVIRETTPLRRIEIEQMWASYRGGRGIA